MCFPRASFRKRAGKTEFSEPFHARVISRSQRKIRRDLIHNESVLNLHTSMSFRFTFAQYGICDRFFDKIETFGGVVLKKVNIV